MRRKKPIIVFFIVSILTNVVLLIHTAILKAEYSWLRDTYEVDIIGAYQSNGAWIAYKEHLEGKPKEYVLDSASPSMGIAVENFYSHTLLQKRSGNIIDRVYLAFTEPQESQRPWHVELQNRWLKAYIKEHNETTSRLLKEVPNEPLQ